MKIVFAIVFLMLAGALLLLMMIGGHGKLMFRPHMTEDWIVWGLASIFTAISIFLIGKEVQQRLKR
jgi:hypothetical protein